VASFLATLLLLILYQAFGQTALYFRRRPSEAPKLLEEYFFRYQFLLLKGDPVLEDGFLFLPVKGLAGPYWLIYDLEKGRYAEFKGPERPKDLEALNWFEEAGIKELKIFVFENGRRESWPLEDGFPKKRPLLLEVRFVSGGRTTVVLR